MCGIFFYHNKNNSRILDENLIKHSINHRGPDSFDKKIINNEIFLYHSRLKIIDLEERANQPMTFNDCHLIYNGEIYNFLELKIKLLDSFTFQTKSDTEVLLKYYLKYGIEKTLEDIEGMYSFCIYDYNKNIIFFARDRFGEKPLYFFDNKNYFILNSENYIFEKKKFSNIDQNSIVKYLFYGYFPNESSIYKDQFKLLPGHYGTYDLKNHKINIKKYWHIPTKQNYKFDTEDIAETLHNSINKSLVSDKKIGFFLSGGIDSSLICSIASKNQRINTFSMNFEEESYNEEEYSDYLSKEINSNHTAFKTNLKNTHEHIINIDKIIDYPMADMSLIPTYILSKEIKKKYTVAIGGDGADELFLSYPTHKAEKLYKIVNLLPNNIKKIIIKFINNLKSSNEDFSYDLILKKFFNNFDQVKILRHIRWNSQLTISEISALIGLSEQSINKIIFGSIDENETPEAFDIKNYLSNDILNKVDIASMKNSLEVRSPFLNHKFAEKVLSIPFHNRFNFFNNKLILKQISKKYLPSVIINRKKHGFGIPITKWIENDLYDLMNDNLKNKNFIETFNFDTQLIEQKLQFHKNKLDNNKRFIWPLYVLSKWLNKH